MSIEGRYDVSSGIRAAGVSSQSSQEIEPERSLTTKPFVLSVISAACLYVPHYDFRIFRNKGAVMVLLWSFSGLCVFQFLTITPVDNLLTLRGKTINSSIAFTMCVFLYPVLGWLADVRYGRYKVIKWSMRIMWVLSILFCIAPLADPSKVLITGGSEKDVLFSVFFILITLSLGGFQANVLQFGIDQLVDASSGEISSFLRWYSWVWFLSGVIVALPKFCLCYYYKLLGYLLLPTVFTVAVSLDYIFNHCLVKEPACKNPFVLIYKVLRYAIKHKYPRQRSAFTYWDDRRFSRIDLAKNKYGGPFTTEQVEDVKTFFRIVVVIMIVTLFISLYVSVYPVFDKIFYRLHDKHYVVYNKHEYKSSCVRNCFQRLTVIYAGHIIMIVGFPLFEFVLYPLFKKYFQRFIFKKWSIGMFLFLLSLVACTAIEFVAQHETHQYFNGSCPLTTYEDQSNSLPLDYWWMMFPYSLTSFAQFVFLTSLGEFLCAQSPYSVKGVLVGFTYGSIGFFAIVGYLLMKLIQLVTEKWLFYRYGCVFWYLILCLVIFCAIIVILFLVFKCYKRRLRDDNEHNEQIFAINYYSQCHNSY